MSSQPEALNGTEHQDFADGLEECRIHKVSKCLLSTYQCQALGFKDKTWESSSFLLRPGHFRAGACCTAVSTPLLA